MTNIAEVIGWKFNHQPGMNCRAIDGVLRIIAFPSGIPSQEDQDKWIAEYETYLGEKAVADEHEKKIKAEMDTIIRSQAVANLKARKELPENY